MERYSVHELKIKYLQTTRHEGEHDSTYFTHLLKEEIFLFITQAQGYTLKHWGRELLKLHIEETYRFSEPLHDDVRYEILSWSERPIRAIVTI